MSETKKDNVTRIRPSNTSSSFPLQFTQNSDIENILVNNMSFVANHWFRFQSEWTYNAYKTLKDLDKYLMKLLRKLKLTVYL